MKRKNAVNKMGFTLLELLIVILIIGLLSAISLPMYKKAVEKSKVADALSTMQAVSKSEHGWYLVKNNYTKDFANLDIDLYDKDGNKAEDEILQGINYTYELLDTGILASRNNGEYTIYQDYDTKQIMCTPGTHFICDNLGAFTKEPCEKLNMAWSDKNTTCYVDNETRCHAVNPGVSNIWHNETGTEAAYCGYVNTKSQTLEDGTKCVGTRQYQQNCENSIIKNGGICEGAEGSEGVCYYAQVYEGGVCNGKVNFACYKATVYSGGICKSYHGNSCQFGTIKKGGECWGLGNDGRLNCTKVTYEGTGATSGCCRYKCPTSAPRCECENHEKMDSNGKCITA